METTAFIGLLFTCDCKPKGRYPSTSSVVAFPWDRRKWRSHKLFLNRGFALTFSPFLGHPAGGSAYTGGSKAEPHEEVEGGTGLAPGDVHAAAAVV